MIIDTHSHIYYDKYDHDLDDVIQRAIDSNIKKIICVAVNLSTAEKCFKLIEKYSIVYMTAGIHPHEASKVPKDYLKQLETYFPHKKTVGLGEIGLDYHYNFSDPKIQLPIFIDQLELAKSYDLPAVVHCREAENDILQGIISTKSDKGVIHCFAGNYNFAKNILDTGYKISFTGLITFTGDTFKEVINKVDLSNIMVETDSPYLTPKPNRGKRNEPEYVRYVIDKICKWKNISFDEAANKTTKTALQVFPKLLN